MNTEDMKYLKNMLYAVDVERLEELHQRTDLLILKQTDYGKPHLDKIRHQFKKILEIKYNDKGNLEIRLKR